ncbi:MAG: hypothetical protein AB1689_18125 [Thermodesulfobacteriota bacterium]
MRPPCHPFAALALALVALACSDAGGPAGETILFGPEGNDLNAYSTGETIVEQAVIRNADEDPGGRDINGQVCFAPDGSRTFVAGEDTGQPDPPAGFGVFRLSGDRVGALSAVQIGKLTPTYQPSADAPDPFGCAFLSDGRLVTTDIGDNATGPANGQVVVWFPPLDAAAPAYCKIDVAVGTAGTVYVDAQERVYVASSRVTPGVLRYENLPTSAVAAGGCDGRDGTGAPLATGVVRELFIPTDASLPTANGVAGAPAGGFYVSSVIAGVIAEYAADGGFVRRILEPAPGETLGPEPLSTGTPLGIAVDASGTVYYADLGLVVRGGSIGPGPGLGTVRRIRFVDGRPLPPEIIASGLDFPDGVGVLEP